ncbi:MAG: hypothetical protein WC841_04110 [Candidatus Shapirobacteria bacterium]|jgi:hypothetical protein
MNKKIITFTMSLKQSQFEVDRLEQEAKKLGVEVNRALYRELSFDLNERSRVFVKGEEVTKENTLGMWFRVAGTISGKYTEGRNMAIRLLQDRIFCANHAGYLGWTRMGKIAQHAVFLENQIPVVATKIFYTKEQVLNPSKSPFDKGDLGLGWPMIAKHERGYQGKSVRKFENFLELEKFVMKMDEINVGMFLWQRYLPTKWDIRVIVLDGKVIGAMKRMARGNEFRSNYSLGGAVEAWDLSDSDRILAEKVAKVCGLDYCGVDIMKSPKSLSPTKVGASPFEERGIFKEEDYDSYILEVNRQCQFKGFEEATGINVAKAVVEMFLKRNSG